MEDRVALGLIFVQTLKFFLFSYQLQFWLCGLWHVAGWVVLDVSEEHYLRHQDLKVFRLKERILRSLAFRVVNQILNRYLITFPMYTCFSFLHNSFQYRKQPLTEHCASASLLRWGHFSGRPSTNSPRWDNPTVVERC